MTLFFIGIAVGLFTGVRFYKFYLARLSKISKAISNVRHGRKAL